MRALGSALLALPKLAWACPNCIGSSPNHRGLIVAAVFLGPIPLLAMAYLVWRIHKDEVGDVHEEKR